jgi:hypothetical protein
MGVEFGLANCTTKQQWTIDESQCRLSLRERAPFRGAKGDKLKHYPKLALPIPMGNTNENRPAITYSATASTKTFRR